MNLLSTRTSPRPPFTISRDPVTSVLHRGFRRFLQEAARDADRYLRVFQLDRIERLYLTGNMLPEERGEQIAIMIRPSGKGK